MQATLQSVFWISVAGVALVTFGYPLLLIVGAPLGRRRPKESESYEPSVTLIIAAYNEESVIKDKLDNTLRLDYPADKLEVFVASDGSTDATNKIVESYADRGIQLADFPRTGKTGVQNRMAQRARGEILVFSDANAEYRQDAIRKLVRKLADPDVGGVSGQLTYHTGNRGAGASEGLYWSYEKLMKQRESDLSSVVGANGSIYAIRKDDYVEIPEDLISDFVEPLAIVRQGKRFLYEPDAISVEPASENYDAEFRRKVRILTRSIRGLLSMRELLNPLRHGIFAIQLTMHKLMRFLTPVFLVTGAASLTALGLSGSYLPLFTIALVGTAGALAVKALNLEGRNILVRLGHLVYYYLMTNYALILAWLNILRGKRITLWAPERPQGS